MTNGQALENFGQDTGEEVGLIRVRLLFRGANIGDSATSVLPSTQRNAAFPWFLSNASGQGVLGNYSQPLPVLLASSIMLLLFYACFLIFGRRAISDVTVLGSSPLLRRSTVFSVLLSIALLAGMTLSSAMVAVVILAL
jgi:hypothetical protein